MQGWQKSPVEISEVKLGPFRQVEKIEMGHFPSVHKIHKENDVVVGAVDKKRSPGSWLGRELEDRFLECAWSLRVSSISVSAHLRILSSWSSCFLSSIERLKFSVSKITFSYNHTKSGDDFCKLVDANKFPKVCTATVNCVIIFGPI